MSGMFWNKINFGNWTAPWSGREVNLSVNEFGQGPIILEIEGYDAADASPSLDYWLTPSEARELAAKLIEAADAADAAGRKMVVSACR